MTVDDKKDSKDGQTEDFPGMPAHVDPVEDVDSMGKNDQSSLEIQRSGVCFSIAFIEMSIFHKLFNFLFVVKGRKFLFKW